MSLRESREQAGPEIWMFLTDISNERLIISTNLSNLGVWRHINCNSFAAETAMKFDSFHRTFGTIVSALARCRFLLLHGGAGPLQKEGINDLNFM